MLEAVLHGQYISCALHRLDTNILLYSTQQPVCCENNRMCEIDSFVAFLTPSG